MKIAHYNSFMELAEKITDSAEVRGSTAGIEWRDGANKTLLKHLEEYGVLGVATVREIHWGNSGSDRQYYWLWITAKGIDLLTGKLKVAEIEKPCICNNHCGYPYVCKQHGDTRK
jgi:hypothetical protein